MAEKRLPGEHVRIGADIAQTPRPRGRPTVEERKVPLTTWVYPGEYLRLQKLAARQDEKISSMVRSLLILRLP